MSFRFFSYTFLLPVSWCSFATVISSIHVIYVMECSSYISLLSKYFYAFLTLFSHSFGTILFSYQRISFSDIYLPWELIWLQFYPLNFIEVPFSLTIIINLYFHNIVSIKYILVLLLALTYLLVSSIGWISEKKFYFLSKSWAGEIRIKITIE